MKRIKNADINFKLNPKRINLNNFSMKFYTVNSEAYFFIKDQDNVVSVEREATIYDDPEVIISGGTVAVDYYLPLDWSELVQLGEGVLNYRCINNIEDPFFPDMAYNQVIEDTTGYYIDSDIIVDPSQTRNIIERVTELESGLAVESIDREEADTAISGAVDTEIARAISAETELSERIDAIESGASEALDAEIERAISAETALQDAIDAEEARAIAIENAIRQDLTDESELRSSADTAMWTAINDEIVRSTSAETALDNKIDVENLRAIGVENAISGDLQTYKATNNAALQAETTRATSAETALQSAINDEATARANADAALGTRIDNISSASTAAIEAEAARAQEAESGLTNAINNEVTRATSAETIIANSLNAEISRASSAETALNNQIDAEVLRATAKENDLEAKIGVVSGVTELINAETLRATTAENALDAKIDQEIADRTADVDAEETRAKGVEDVLSGAIDTIDAKFIDDAKYEMSGQTHVINFYNGNTIKATIDCTDFLVDGMIDDVRIENGYLVIDFNTASGKQDIRIPLTDIFNPANYYTKSETSGATEIANALALKLNISDFNVYSGNVATALSEKASQSAVDALNGVVTAHTADTIIHVTSSDKEKWNKVDDKADTTALTAVNDALTAHTADSVAHITAAERTAWNAKADESAFTAHTADTTIHLTSGDVQSQISGKANSDDVYLKTETSGATEIATALADKLDATAYTPVDLSNYYTKSETSGKTEISTALAGKVDSSSIVSSVTSASTDSELPTAKAVYDALGQGGGGISSAECQTMIDNSIDVVNQVIEDNEEVTAQALNVLNGELANKLDASAYTPTDLSNYYTKSQTSGATEIYTALSGKQDTLVSSENIKTINNESILGSGNITIQSGGGKAVTGGTNISVVTGETADIINCTLPIIKGVNLGATSREHSVMIGYNNQQNVGNYIKKDYSASIGFTNTIDAERSVCLGSSNFAKGYCSIAMGETNSAMTNYSVASGRNSKTSNEYEFASGRYNVSSSASTTFGDSGNTLFSVGNGTADNARHNAFEIRQNGDIYITKDGQDVKLQDQLGGGGGGITSGECQTLIDQSISGKTNQSDFTGHTADTTAHVTQSEKNTWNAKSDFSGSYNDLTDKPTIPTVPTSNTAFTNDAGYITANDITGKTDVTAFTAHTSDTTIHVTSSDKTSWNGAVTALGGLSLVKLTQAQYDALSTKDNNTLYVIVG